MAEYILPKNTLSNGPYGSIFPSDHVWKSSKELPTRSDVDGTNLIYCTDTTYASNRIVENSKIAIASTPTTQTWSLCCDFSFNDYYVRGANMITSVSLTNSMYYYDQSSLQYELIYDNSQIVNISASTSGTTGLGASFAAYKTTSIRVIIGTQTASSKPANPTSSDYAYLIAYGGVNTLSFTASNVKSGNFIGYSDGTSIGGQTFELTMQSYYFTWKVL